MKKCITTIVTLVLTTGFASAVSLPEGTKAIQFSGSLDLDSADGTVIDFNLGYGVFVVDQVEVGVRGNIYDSDSATRWGLGAFSEYNWIMETAWVPYAGLALDYQDSDVNIGAGTTDNALQVGGRVGVKYFLTEGLAIDSAYVFNWATEDIYLEDQSVSDTESLFAFGLRYYFQ